MQHVLCMLFACCRHRNMAIMHVAGNMHWSSDCGFVKDNYEQSNSKLLFDTCASCKPFILKLIWLMDAGLMIMITTKVNTIWKPTNTVHKDLFLIRGNMNDLFIDYFEQLFVMSCKNVSNVIARFLFIPSENWMVLYDFISCSFCTAVIENYWTFFLNLIFIDGWK